MEEPPMPRGPRFDAPRTLQHVIVRGIERRRIADDDQDRERLLTRLGDLAQQTHTAVCTWALMENHAHLLVRRGPGGLPGFMRRLLTAHATYHSRRHRRHGHLFQNRCTSMNWPVFSRCNWASPLPRPPADSG
jgi:REP element-mobilizing transposase RayT